MADAQGEKTAPGLLKTNDYAGLLSANTRFIDVRAETEFALGSLPGAVNLPILDDTERHRVGICHKSNGPEAATALGHKIVSGKLKQSRINGWLAEAQAARPEPAVVVCWRGGQRSQIAQQWLSEAGLRIPRIDGGFKAMRHFCLQQLEQFAHHPKPWILIGGRTGSGKTAVLNSVSASIDLEGHAHHRGSAFGGYPDGQPTPINFENALARTSLLHSAPLVVLEDEGSTIGRLGLPRSWHNRMQKTPLVQLEVDQQVRIEHIFSEYVGTDTTNHVLAEQYLDALQRINRRLGGARAKELQALVIQAFETGAIDTHHAWIKGLLDSYYDPMYDYQLAKKQDRIKFRGNAAEVINFLQASSTQDY